MADAFEKPVRKRVGGSLRNVPVMKRIASLQANALLLKGQKQWTPPTNDGTHVRKTVGSSR